MNKMAEFICKHFGHTWITTDLSNSIKANGEGYKFSKKRLCTRCRMQDYFYGEWVPGTNVLGEDKDEGFSEFNKMENKKALHSELNK